MKILQILAIALVLCSLAQSKDCKVNPHQSFDLLQDKGIQEYTENGNLFLDSDSEILWKADLAQPVNNTLLRFKLQVHTDDNFSLFVPKMKVQSKELDEAYFKLYFPPGAQEMNLEFFYGDNYLPLTAKLDWRIFLKPQWIAVYFQKDYVSLYYGKRLNRLLRLENPQQNPLNMFSLYNSVEKLKYSIYEVVNDGSALIQDLQIFNDVNQEQEDCLLWDYDPKLSLTDKFMDFFGL